MSQPGAPPESQGTNRAVFGPQGHVVDPPVAPVAPAGPGAPPFSPTAPVPQPPAVVPAPQRSRWRLVRRLLVVFLLTVFVVLVGAGCWAADTYRSIERVELGDALSGGDPGFQNILIVGTDSRADFDPENPTADPDVATGAPAGSRTDTILVLQLRGDQASMLSLPRDLWLINAETGEPGRLNAAYRAGPANLVATIEDSLQIPIHNYAEIDFGGFRELVDATGGITVDFAHPAFDNGSGLDIAESGEVELDGDQALAYVRSRRYTERIDGEQVRDPTADLGRVARQQKFLRALFGELEGIRNPVTLNRVTRAISGTVVIDDTIDFVDSVQLFRRLQGLDPEPFVVPVTPRTTSGGAQVLDVNQTQAPEVLERFGASP